MDAFIGIDVACARGKYLPLVVCYRKANQLVPLPLAYVPIKPPKGLGNAATLNDETNTHLAHETAKYVELICEQHNLNPVCIGIDSPLRPRNYDLRRRLAEQALDKAGISCFTTPSSDEFATIKLRGLAHLEQGKPKQNLPHSMQIFMLFGFALFQRLSKIAPCIEVYPHATVKQLGVADIHKSKGKQAELQLAAIAEHTGWPKTTEDWQLAESMCLGSMHDKVDAYSAAWVASLPSEERLCFGEPDKQDAIWIPKVETQSGSMADIPKRQKKVTPSASVSNRKHQKTCPACGNHVFKRWPFGWDAHAAHRCTGLSATEQEARKAEFKWRFLS